ncbi:MAG: GrrA/OscA1 family cyclophane-containing rSAM-modified RiPP [Cyanobacteriota bacterium]|jgi:rSAM-associated Gly-rich repeat protein
MKTPIGWTAFILALSTLVGAETAQAATQNSAPDLETRLSRLGETLRTKANQLPEQNPNPGDLALGWGNGGGGGRGFVNTRRGGWGDGSGGRGFVNVNPWRNGWGDGGGFWNRPWRNGGGFVNW